MDKIDLFVGGVIGWIFALLFASIILNIYYIPKKQAIKHNYAQYNPQTGSFEWKEVRK